MDERGKVEVLFLGNIAHQNQLQIQGSEKSGYQDQISFADPVHIQLIRIPTNGKQLYSKLTSLTQKQPIKSLEIYYRNLDKKLARYSLLVCPSSELLVSSSVDILLILKETIYTDLLVIRGNFTNITFCIYGHVLRSKQEIEKKCPYFVNNIDVPLKDEQPSIKINRNVFDQSRSIVKAIEDQYSVNTDDKVQSWGGFSNDRELYDSQITNICKLSQQLLAYEDLNHIDQRSIAQIRGKLQTMQSVLSKLFKSAHIGLFYPTPYRQSAIPDSIPITIVKIAGRLLSESLSDQFRALEVLKLILQLGPHAQYFVKSGGVQAMIRLFLQFFSSNLVILSSLKSLVIEVFIVLSFWDFSAQKMVDKIPALFEELLHKSVSQLQNKQQGDEGESPEKSRSKSRSREKKKKRSQQSSSRSSQRQKKKSKKDKKSKKNKQKQRQRSRQKDRKKEKNRSTQKQKQKGKQRKQSEKQKNENKKDKDEKDDKTNKMVSEEIELKNQLSSCCSFYQILFKVIRVEKNSKLQLLLRILLQQITQTLTKNTDISNQLAYYTPLLRDTKYMFNQGGEMINSKTLKTFASFQPFLNSLQSKGVESIFICQSQKIKHPQKYGISSKLFKLIDSALTILQSRSENETPLIFDQQFMTLISALIENNKNGVSIGLNYFIEALKIDSEQGLKKQEAVVAILCQYIHEVFVEDEGMNLVYFLDQVHNSMLKIINWLKEDKTFSILIKRKVQYLINSALIYNHFSGTENNFKSFSEYFIKLIGHEHLEISKILEYSRKQYHRTANPLSFTNISQNFALGNFYDVLPAQPLLQIDICLRMFLSILKLNKNIWTIFYQFKFVPAFATLYTRIFSLLKFFLSPSLQRQNAIIDIKMFDRLINNYLQVAKNLINIFIVKWKYESAFNELSEEQDIFSEVELYYKWVDTYLFLYHSIYNKDNLLFQQRTKNKQSKLLTNIIQLYDTIFKGYQLTKNEYRQRNIKTTIKHIYRQHYESIIYRSSILSLLKSFLLVSGPITAQVIIQELFNCTLRDDKENFDVLLPDNDKSMFENIVRKNVYRSDQEVVKNLAGFVSEMIKRQNASERVWDILQALLDQNEVSANEDNQDGSPSSYVVEKSCMLANFMSYITAPMNTKIQQHMLRLLKQLSQIRSSSNLAQPLDKNKQKLRNSYLCFFKSAIKYNKQFSTQIYQQLLKIINNIFQSEINNEDIKIRCQQLTCIQISLDFLIHALSNLQFQSILLYGQFLEKPNKPASQLTLDKVLGFLKDKLLASMTDQTEIFLISNIGLGLCYLLSKLTTIDGSEYYSTESRKTAIQHLISPTKSQSIQQTLSILESYAPSQLLHSLKTYLQFPIMEKPQSVPSPATSSSNQSAGSLYSKGVFTVISQNDIVGKTRYELIQQKWEGGDIDHQIYHVNQSIDYDRLVEKQILHCNFDIRLGVRDAILIKYSGAHSARDVNGLFSFKIRKIFTTDAKKNAVCANTVISMKTIPTQLKKPQLVKQSYQTKLLTSPPSKTAQAAYSSPSFSPSSTHLMQPSTNPTNSQRMNSNGNTVNSTNATNINSANNIQNVNNPNTNIANNQITSSNAYGNGQQQSGYNTGVVRASSSHGRENSPYVGKQGHINTQQTQQSNNPQYYSNPNPNYNHPTTTPSTYTPPIQPTYTQPTQPYTPPTPPNYYPQQPRPVYNQQKQYQHQHQYQPQPPVPTSYYPSYQPRHTHTQYPQPYILPQQQPQYPTAPVAPPRGQPQTQYSTGYGPQIGGYQGMGVGMGQKTARQIEQQTFNEVVNIFFFVKQNPQMATERKNELMTKANNIMKANPVIGARVTKYFDDLKKGQAP